MSCVITVEFIATIVLLCVGFAVGGVVVVKGVFSFFVFVATTSLSVFILSPPLRLSAIKVLFDLSVFYVRLSFDPLNNQFVFCRFTLLSAHTCRKGQL